MTKTMNKTCIKPPYFYDGSILLAEKVGSQVQKIYINDGQGIVGMVRPIYDGSTLTHYQRLYYLYDSLGSVSAVTGENGLPLTGYKYTPYGSCMNVSNDPINNLQFIGRYGGYLDNDTGLTYFWHRWYDSSVGRWISRDPIGVKGGINECHRKNCEKAYSDCVNAATNTYENNIKINYAVEVACDISCHLIASAIITPLGALAVCSGSCYAIGLAMDKGAEKQYGLDLDLCNANLQLCLQPGQGW